MSVFLYNSLLWEYQHTYKKMDTHEHCLSEDTNKWTSDDKTADKDQ